MKTIAKIYIVLAMILISAETFAQKNLNVEYIFDHIEEMSKQHNQVFMSGDNVRQYGLELFRSITSQRSRDVVDKMRQAALKDGESAVAQKTIVRDGVTVACYYQLPPAEGANVNRFVLFRQMDEQSAMLIYIEGNKTLDSIVNIKLNKK
ncbi:MAG: DUF6108 family protein [Bacteroidales bacterium]|nr:DUF6108 family protein [Bacteroidales bacterium]